MNFASCLCKKIIHNGSCIRITPVIILSYRRTISMTLETSSHGYHLFYISDQFRLSRKYFCQIRHRTKCDNGYFFSLQKFCQKINRILLLIFTFHFRKKAFSKSIHPMGIPRINVFFPERNFFSNIDWNIHSSKLLQNLSRISRPHIRWHIT